MPAVSGPSPGPRGGSADQSPDIPHHHSVGERLAPDHPDLVDIHDSGKQSAGADQHPRSTTRRVGVVGLSRVSPTPTRLASRARSLVSIARCRSPGRSPSRKSEPVASIDRHAPVHHPDRLPHCRFDRRLAEDLSHRTGGAATWCSATAASDRQARLRHMNARGWNVYVSVNAYRPGRSRARDAVSTVRHLFLEEDRDGPGLLAALSTRADLPPASYVLHSSPGRLHALWRVHDITPVSIESLQKQLARELSTDRAATSCAQTTICVNHKRQPAVVPGEVEYLHCGDVLAS